MGWCWSSEPIGWPSWPPIPPRRPTWWWPAGRPGATRCEPVWRPCRPRPTSSSCTTRLAPWPPRRSLERWSMPSETASTAAIPVLPVVDTVKQVDGDGTVVATLDRSTLVSVQTPQAFRASSLRAAHAAGAGRDRRCRGDRAVGWQGGDGAGGARQPQDHGRRRSGAHAHDGWTTASRGPIMSVRVGMGIDAHRFSDDPARPLVLGGVTIEDARGLEGHSDADAIAHACADALLGAVALGDIGQHFPDTDDRWAGADSISLLREVAGMVRAEGWEPSNLDCTVVLEAPRMAPHRDGDAGAAQRGGRGAGAREGDPRRADGCARAGRRGGLLGRGPGDRPVSPGRKKSTVAHRSRPLVRRRRGARALPGGRTGTGPGASPGTRESGRVHSSPNATPAAAAPHGGQAGALRRAAAERHRPTAPDRRTGPRRRSGRGPAGRARAVARRSPQGPRDPDRSRSRLRRDPRRHHRAGGRRPGARLRGRRQPSSDRSPRPTPPRASSPGPSRSTRSTSTPWRRPTAAARPSSSSSTG